MTSVESGKQLRVAGTLAAAIIALGLLGVAATLSSVEYELAADEGYYAAYAGRVARDGLSSLPELSREYLGQSRHHTLPNPLRAGYLALAGGWTALRQNGPLALSELSLASHAVALGIAAAFCIRALGARIGLIATALLTFSPLLLGLSRRALADATATAAGFALLAAAYSLARAPDSRKRTLAVVGAVAAALLVKESSLLLLLPCLGAVFVAAPREQRVGTSLRFSLAAATGIALALIGWVNTSGGANAFAEITRIILFSPESNLYAQQFGGGPWSRYLIDLLLLSPWTTLIALCALPAALVRFSDETSHALLLFLAVFTLGVGISHEFFTKNVRYVALLEFPIRVFAAWAIVRSSRAFPESARLPFCLMATFTLCLLDAASFYEIFIEDGLYDPVTAQLMRVRGLLPPW